MALGDIAAKLGVPVFPCLGNKKPAIAKGFQSATADPSAILTAFNRPGAELIGMPTGSASGLIAIDVDIRDTRSGMSWLEDNREALPQTRTHRTQSGGLHLLFRCPDVEIRNSQGQVAAGVDVRGEGGYIIMPPSAGYAIADHVEPAEMPRWLIRACLPPERAKPLNGHATPIEIESKRLKAFYERELDRVRGANDGEKHEKLRNAALSIGGIADQAGLTEDSVWRDLQHALPASVEDWRGAEKTARWGFQAGRGQPITLEDRPEYRREEITLKPQPTAAHSVKQAPEEITPPKDSGRLFPVEFFKDIQPNTDIADFVEGLLIKSVMSVIYGESNSGKTFFATDLGLHIAAGWAWNGREVDRCAVIYCALEGSFGIRNRVAAFREHYGLHSYELPFAVIPYAMNLLNPDADTAPLIATVNDVSKSLGFENPVVVIDTLSRAMAGGNENAPDDMGALVMNGDRIRQQTGAHLLFVHHSGKDQAKGARGHSLLRAATDTEIEITADGPQRMARVTKQRDLDCSGEFAFTLKVVELGKNRRGKPVASCVVDYGDSAALGRGHDPGGSSARRHLKGHNKRALEVLIDLCAASGQTGYAGIPSGMSSVPEKWWRERFYERAMPGEKDDTKKRAFGRASDALINSRLVGMTNHRVWVVHFSATEGGDNEPS